MTIGARWKILASHLVVVFVMSAVFYGYSYRSMEKHLLRETTVVVTGEARLAQLTAAGIRNLAADAPGVAAAIAASTGTRTTIIAADGTVVGDSEVPAADLKSLENHLNRSEVQQALAVGVGTSVRYSETLKIRMLYVAVPFADAGNDKGFVRLALPLASLKRMSSTFNVMLVVAMALAAVVSVLVSYILAMVASRPLRTMAKMADQLGRGETAKRIPVSSRDEIGQLAEVMNHMAARIETQLATVAEEKNRLDTILRGMGEGLMVTDCAGVVTLVNPAFHSLFPLEDAVEGKRLVEINRHPSLNDGFRLVVETRCERIEEMNLPTEGGKAILIHWVPLTEHGEMKGVVAVLHDITDLKRLENIRRDFVANVSHELRTPVAIIKGYAETLLADIREVTPETLERFLGIIHTHSERLATLIGDLLTLSVMESGDTVLDLSPTQLEGFIRPAVTLLEGKARSKGVLLEVAHVAVSPVMADAKKMEQVMINLLDNAVKYTPEGGNITVTATEADGLVKISVADTGVGIPAKDLERIFERFYRVDASRTREQGGTGLGLSIVKHIVHLHGGTISVNSTPGKGSVFTFTLRKS